MDANFSLCFPGWSFNFVHDIFKFQISERFLLFIFLFLFPSYDVVCLKPEQVIFDGEIVLRRLHQFFPFLFEIWVAGKWWGSGLVATQHKFWINFTYLGCIQWNGKEEESSRLFSLMWFFVQVNLDDCSFVLNRLIRKESSAQYGKLHYCSKWWHKMKLHRKFPSKRAAAFNGARSFAHNKAVQ